MRCLKPVSRLKSVLFPEFGRPTTAMLVAARRLTEISLAGTRISRCLVTGCDEDNLEAPRLLLAQRDAAAKEPEFERVAPQSSTG